MSEINIALIDHRTLVREGLKQLLNGGSFHVVMEGKELRQVAERLQAAEDDLDLVIFDFNAEALADERQERLEEIMRLKPGIRTITLSDQMCIDRLTWSVHAGVDGFLLKDISPSAFRRSIQLVMLGEKVFPTDLASWLAKRVPVFADLGSSRTVAAKGLSNREIEILRRLMQGQPNKVIANDLDITEATVKVHLKGILRKIGVKNRTQAAIWALNNGVTATFASAEPAEPPRISGRRAEESRHGLPAELRAGR